MKKILAILGLFVVLGGLVFAIRGASVTEGTQTRWTMASAGNVVTEGGNITPVNISSDYLTDKWADFYGNVSGNLRLWDGTNTVYQWTWAATNGGEVCVTTDANFDWTAVAHAQHSTDTQNMDTAWSFASADTDSINNTMTTNTCSLTFSQGSVTNTANVSLMGSSSFNVCAVTDSAGSTTKGDYAFCTEMNNSGTNYAGDSVNYELMVPTPKADGTTETYYFFAELN